MLAASSLPGAADPVVARKTKKKKHHTAAAPPAQAQPPPPPQEMWPAPHDETEAFCEFTPVCDETHVPEAFGGWDEAGGLFELEEDGDPDYDRLDGESVLDDTPLVSEASEASEDEDILDADCGPLMLDVGIGARRCERRAASKMLWSGARVVPEDDSHIY